MTPFEAWGTGIVAAWSGPLVVVVVLAAVVAAALLARALAPRR